MINVAAVGCGEMMKRHCSHLAAMERVQIVGHCDVEKVRADEAAHQFGGEAFTSVTEMYDQAKPDAVYITVPPYAHGEIEEEAVARGIHLFIEKPLALDRAVAKRIAAAIRRSDTLASVGYSYRYLDTVAIARQMLKGKAVTLIQGCCTCGMPDVWWWRQMDKSGGQFLAQTTDLFDLVRYLCGEVSEIYAVASNGCMSNVEHYDIQDSSVAVLRMKNGATAAISASCVARHDGRFGLEIVTPEATYTLCKNSLVVKEEGKTTEHHAQLDKVAEENAAFIDAIRQKKKARIRSPYSDAMRSCSLSWAANESIKSGMPTKP
jgi:predicted dehydrogenase